MHKLKHTTNSPRVYREAASPHGTLELTVSNKRSPILGYNHNVQYRGLIFHVQTEDSGVRSPHVFTHLFHGGVIVNTRKLVYDAGTAEEGIKALMQAQHKAVMKDLKKGTFDSKIDEYLGDTPGLTPAPARAEEPVRTPTSDITAAAVPFLGHERSPRDTLVNEPSPIEIHEERTDRVQISVPPPVAVPTPRPPIMPATAATTIPSRATFEAYAAQRATASGLGRGGAPERERIAVEQPAAPLPPAPQGRVSTQDITGAIESMRPLLEAAKIIQPNRATPAMGSHVPQQPSPPTRLRRPSVSPPEAIAQALADELGLGTAGVVARPLGDPESGPANSQYAQHRRRTSSQIMHAQTVVEPRRSAPMPAVQPPDLRRSSSVIPAQDPPSRPHLPPADARRTAVFATPPHAEPPTLPRGSSELAAPRTPSGRQRPPTPNRSIAASATMRRRASSSGGAGVVMSKPAVVVGTPAKSGANYQTQIRVRNAREEASPSISEKSLDDVILAYLSEDSKRR